MTKKTYTQKAFLPSWLLLTVALASVQSPEAAAAGKAADSESARIFLAGDIGGFDDGRSLVAPRGGLSGLLETIRCLEKGGTDCNYRDKLIPEEAAPADLKILMGNTLGREAKAAYWSSGGTLPMLDITRSSSVRRLEIPSELQGLLTEYDDAGLSLECCPSLLDESGRVSQEAVRICRRNLVVWKAERVFQAIAVGPGDLNAVLDLDPEELRRSVATPSRRGWDDLLKELRYYPFVASNLFLTSEKFADPRIEKSLKKPFLFNREIMPTDSIAIKLDGSLNDIKIKLSWGKALDITLDPQYPAPYSSDFQQVFLVRVGAGAYTIVFDASNVAPKDGALTIPWPIPLTPNSIYTITIQHKSPRAPDTAVFSTLDTFSVAGRTNRGKRGCPADLGAKQHPVLQRTDGLAENTEKQWLEMPWGLAGRLPIVQFKPDLRIVAVLDENTRRVLPRPAEGELGDRSKILNQLQFMGMQRAIEHYGDLMRWGHRHKAILQLLEEISSGMMSEETKGEIQRYENLKRRSEHWGEDTDWALEDAAWRKLLGKQKEIDWRVPSIVRTVGHLEPSARTVLLIQADKDRVEELLSRTSISGRHATSQRPEVVLVAGAARPDESSTFQPGKGASTLDFPVIYPDAFAESIDLLELKTQRTENKRERNWTHQRLSVYGRQLTLISEKSGKPLKDVKPLTRLGAEVFSDSKPPTQAQRGADGTAIARALAQTMREFAVAEVAVLDRGSIDPDVLQSLRSLHWISQGNRVNLAKDPPLKVTQLPMVDAELARSILAAGVETVQARPGQGKPFERCSRSGSSSGSLCWFFLNLVQYCQNPGCGYSSKLFVDNIMEWYLWLTYDGRRNPRIDESHFTNQIFHRLVAVDDEIVKLVMTRQQLAAFLKEQAASDIEVVQVGVGSDSRLHGRKLDGDLPVTVAIPARLALGSQSAFPALNSSNILDKAARFRCAGAKPPIDGRVITLRRLLSELAGPSCSPRRGRAGQGTVAPTSNGPGKNAALAMTASQASASSSAMGSGDRALSRITAYNKRFFWQFSLKKIDVEFRKISVTDEFRGGVSDSLAEAMDESRFKSHPEFLLGLYWPSVDIETTLKLDFNRSRIADNPVNYTEDLWAVRTQADYYAFDSKGNVSYPIFFAIERRNQLRAPTERISLKLMDPTGAINTFKPVFRRPKQSELNGEVGWLVTNEQRSRFFQIGYIAGQAFGLAEESMLVRLPILDTLVEVDRNSTIEISEEITDDSEVNRFLGLRIPTRDRFQHGLSLRAKYERQFGPETRRLKLSTELSDFRFYFNRASDDSSQIRLRALLETRIEVPVYGNLKIVPGFRFFALRPKRGDDSEMDDEMMTDEMKKDNFFRNEPFIQIEYSFDLTRPFMNFWDAIRFKNKK